MSGCYGDSPEDRYFENKLNEYLDSLDTTEDGWYCPSCDEVKPEDKVSFEMVCLDCYCGVHWK